MRRNLTCCALVFSAVLSLAPEIVAQHARSFEQLQMLVKCDDTVSITEADGKITRGRIVQVTNSSLQLMSDGALKDLPEAGVLQITQRRKDPLANGAKYGAVAGLTMGVLGAIVQLAVIDDCVGCAVGIATVYTALGAGIGVGIDAVIVREKTIFTMDRNTFNRIRIKPLLSTRGKGISVSFSF
jgi:hypothetical protein